MSEIIRIGRDDLGLRTVSPAREKIDLALSRVEQPRKPIEVQRQVTASEVIDLPRVCAWHVGKAYMSRFVRQSDGKFAYHGGIKFTPSIQEQYRGYAVVASVRSAMERPPRVSSLVPVVIVVR
jgi:hypothetical protein